MAVSMRPAPPDAFPPEGYEWVATIDDSLDWLVLGPDDERRPCRWGRGACGKPSVAILYRGRQRQRWHYCAEHLYGRWIETGHVMSWHMQRVGPAR